MTYPITQQGLTMMHLPGLFILEGMAKVIVPPALFNLFNKLPRPSSPYPHNTNEAKVLRNVALFEHGGRE
jgi:hypothetical protein